MITTQKPQIVCSLLVTALTLCCNWGTAEPHQQASILTHEDGETIALVGNGLGSRMMQHGYFETEIYLQNPDKNLKVRNLCDECNTPGFRPHAGRTNPWAFPGAEAFTEQFNVREKHGTTQIGRGFEKSPDEWLHDVKPDTMIAFFGFNESFNGPEGLASFKKELAGYLSHIKKSSFSKKPPKVVLVSPIAFQNLSATYNTPDGITANKNLALYTAAMKGVAAEQNILFVDIFHPTLDLFERVKTPLTVDGASLNKDGYKKLANLLASRLYGSRRTRRDTPQLTEKVRDKNWYWHNTFKTPNGVHVSGVRHKPYGPANYPDEQKKLVQLVSNRDKAIWAMLKGDAYDLAAADKATHTLPAVETNFRVSVKNGSEKYLHAKNALDSFTLPKGYKIDLFASEKEFPDLANPVQMSFDNQGRLWVAVMPSYPHHKPGDPRPDDKLIILEDTNKDGKADKQHVFADGLHLPIGFELAPEGVYIAQLPHLILLKDTDRDGKADSREILLSGFDDHDTHHAISAFSADPSGAIYMCEGTFLHSNVETAYGPRRNFGGGFFRFDPRTRHLERSARLGLPNPWGVAVDDWGQNFYIVARNFHWMLPGTVKTKYGQFAPTPEALVKTDIVRPSCGVEFVSSSHFPDDVQGDVLVNNTIGFRGAKQHRIEENGTGFKTSFRHDLFSSSDGNVRPVDLEFAPDGSLYFLDWHNILVGHMQHNARDPLRDHRHGRIYRITYPSRPLVTPARIHEAPLQVLFENLKLPEYRSRYRTRRELRGRDADDVRDGLKSWVKTLDENDPRHTHHLLEALWVSWGVGQIDQDILRTLLKSTDHRAQSAAVNVLRYSGEQVTDKPTLLTAAATNDHGRVRLEAVIAASWMNKDDGMPAITAAEQQPQDAILTSTLKIAKAQLNNRPIEVTKEKRLKVPRHLKGQDRKLFVKGHEIYSREGFCVTCHQENGKGLPAAQFPPLDQSLWVTGSQERLIKITLHGLQGPIDVKGKSFPGLVPMTAFKHLTDQEIAAVLTYVRNAFGNKASSVNPGSVKKVRESTKGIKQFYAPSDLLKTHPHDK